MLGSVASFGPTASADSRSSQLRLGAESRRSSTADASQYPRLKAYVQGVVGAFAKDDRILAWDVWNEPGSDNAGSYGKEELEEKDKIAG